ncbi:hypothetical protein M422DRAFT_25736 [Sphaerobolus stellatus SS14]|nr:hypothetical protein M422DRAFT_25736 [Sphaerobolus stellatus SS14]
MRFSTIIAALLPAFTVSAATVNTLTNFGSATEPNIFLDLGGDEEPGFLTTVTLSTGDQVPALVQDFTAASNAFFSNSVFMVQPPNATSFLGIQLLTTQGPTGAAPKGLNYVAVKGTQAQGAMGFYVSAANDNVFSTNTKTFRSFVHCSSVTVGNTGLPQLFWAAAGTKTPSGCINTQFAARAR